MTIMSLSLSRLFGGRRRRLDPAPMADILARLATVTA